MPRSKEVSLLQGVSGKGNIGRAASSSDVLFSQGSLKIVVSFARISAALSGAPEGVFRKAFRSAVGVSKGLSDAAGTRFRSRRERFPVPPEFFGMSADFSQRFSRHRGMSPLPRGFGGIGATSPPLFGAFSAVPGESSPPLPLRRNIFRRPVRFFCAPAPHCRADFRQFPTVPFRVRGNLRGFQGNVSGCAPTPLRFRCVAAEDFREFSPLLRAYLRNIPLPRRFPGHPPREHRKGGKGSKRDLAHL